MIFILPIIAALGKIISSAAKTAGNALTKDVASALGKTGETVIAGGPGGGEVGAGKAADPMSLLFQSAPMLQDLIQQSPIGWTENPTTGPRTSSENPLATVLPKSAPSVMESLGGMPMDHSLAMTALEPSIDPQKPLTGIAKTVDSLSQGVQRFNNLIGKVTNPVNRVVDTATSPITALTSPVSNLVGDVTQPVTGVANALADPIGAIAGAIEPLRTPGLTKKLEAEQTKAQTIADAAQVLEGIKQYNRIDLEGLKQEGKIDIEKLKQKDITSLDEALLKKTITPEQYRLYKQSGGKPTRAMHVEEVASDLMKNNPNLSRADAIVQGYDRLSKDPSWRTAHQPEIELLKNYLPTGDMQKTLISINPDQRMKLGAEAWTRLLNQRTQLESKKLDLDFIVQMMTAAYGPLPAEIRAQFENIK